MSSDFRLASDFLSHHKVRRLRAKLGADGVLAWLALIGYTASNKPDGCLTGLDREDIPLVSDWSGEQDFVATLLNLHLLDEHDKFFSLHNWSERQPWIVSSKKRRSKAQKAAQTRWEKRESARPKEQCPEHATSIQPASAEHAHSNALYPTQPNHTQPESGALFRPFEKTENGNCPKDRRKAKTLLLDGFALTPKLRQIAATHGLDPQHEFSAFTADARAENRTHANWEAAFEKWCLNSVKFSRERNGAGRINAVTPLTSAAEYLSRTT